jgi:drug/metabolite transporter (DMT)-like permease
MKNNQLIILIPMLAGTFYHLGQKSLKAVINPFLLFAITYFVGAVIMLLLYFFNTQSLTIKIPNLDFKSLTSMFLITLGFMGIELGFLLVYRSGLPVSHSSFVSSLGTSMILLFFGIFFFQEVISFKQWIGLACAFIAFILLMK